MICFPYTPGPASTFLQELGERLEAAVNAGVENLLLMLNGCGLCFEALDLGPGLLASRVHSRHLRNQRIDSSLVLCCRLRRWGGDTVVHAEFLLLRRHALLDLQPVLAHLVEHSVNLAKLVL